MVKIKKEYAKRFIPKSSPIQPDNYRDIFLDRAAVFSVPTMIERYHFDEHNINAMFYIELCTWSEYRPYFEEVKVLMQEKDCRRVIYNAKSIKDAIEYLSPLMDRIRYKGNE